MINLLIEERIYFDIVKKIINQILIKLNKIAKIHISKKIVRIHIINNNIIEKNN